jgi:hypothetical protein
MKSFITNISDDKIRFLFLVLTSYFLLISADAYPQDNHHQMNDSTLIHRQHMIHSDSPEVMPFDMDKVTHYFIKTDSGGILMIRTKDARDTAQARLIVSHLEKEYKLFSNADFRDPKLLHGADMPGLHILTRSKGKFKVEFRKLKDGAQLTFTSKDPEVKNAIHTWFDAQLRDHGSDAKSRLD